MDSKDNGNKGARSYRGQILGDSMAITINFKWLIQIIIFVAMVVYGWYQLETRIQVLERNMELALLEIKLHEEERQISADKQKKALEKQLQEQSVWIEKELGINLNPFSWGKSRK